MRFIPGVEGAWKVCGRYTGGAQYVCTEVQGMWEVCRRCIKCAWKVMGRQNKEITLKWDFPPQGEYLVHYISV